MKQIIKPVTSINGSLVVPGDKSISHRAVMLGAIAKGETEISGFLNADDCQSTIRVFRQLGTTIEQIDSTTYKVTGLGLRGLQEPTEILDVGNSGTTIRLIAGILAGQNIYTVLTGDSSIVKRPMKRVVEPLVQMGAIIDGRDNGNYAPLTIRGNALNGITYQSKVASAQVKSAILFAGLYADTTTTVIEPYLSRDHSEKMLSQFGAKLNIEEGRVTVWPIEELSGQKVIVPGDFSSAAFFIAAALIVPNSKLLIKNVGVNPARIGFLEAVIAMKGKVELINQRNYGNEPVADLLVESSELEGIEISGEWIPKIIDELPLIAVLGCYAEGVTKVTSAKELRVKETDRIQSIHVGLANLGVTVDELEDGFIIEGKQSINGGVVSSFGDHRIGMALAIAGLAAKKQVVIERAEAISISYPQFFEDLAALCKD